MEFLFRLAFPYVALGALGIIVAAVWWRIKYYQQVTYCYSLTDELAQADIATPFNSRALSFVLRLAALILLALLLGRPQLVDVKSTMQVDGIDMMLVLDVSGSMSHSDDERDNRSRIDAAKEAAVEFINKRTYDPIGLVYFANQCVARCPLTLDKKILTSLVEEFRLGDVDYQGTMLGTGIAMGVNRLKNSDSKNKVMILLTDGTPSSGDLPIGEAVAMAKRFGIKIYTIGVGSDVPKMVRIGFQVGSIPPVNKELLKEIAQKTGGKFFEAKKPRELQKIYNDIDLLERTVIDTDIFTRYYELLMPFLLLVLLLVASELIVSLIWFCL